MVIRDYGNCLTCDAGYILRAGVGVEKYHEHYFDCVECGSPITVAVKTDAPNAWYEVVDNFRLIKSEPQNAHIINLHPNFAFTHEQYHSKQTFVSLEQGARIIPLVRPTSGKYQNDLAAVFDVPNTKHIWSLVKRGIILAKQNNSPKELHRLLSDFNRQRQEYRPETNANNSKEMLYSFFIDLFYPRIQELLDPAFELYETIKEKHSGEVERFINDYRSEMQEERFENFLSIFSSYFRNQGHFSQLASYARINDDNVDDLIVGSKSFEHINLYYGQAFETLTSAVSILAAFNNILSGRPYDQFQHMNWNKYLKDVDKSKRANPFSNEPAFAAFASCLNNTLRNGSHHASIWREGETIYYRSGGSGEKREIPYTQYIHLCNKITIALAALWLLEITTLVG